MNGGAHSTDHPPSHAGRHRRGGTGTWTPAVPPPQQVPRRHRRAAPEFADPPASGSLPLISQIMEEGTSRGSTSGFLSSTGSLPVPRTASPEPAPTPEPAPLPPPGQADEPTGTANPLVAPGPPARTRVTLTPPKRRRDDDDEARVYALPPADGLGTFDLGSVPASVTPPRTWRKAAWFAAVSSGGVVVSLLFAGSYLMGKPEDSRAMPNWPGMQGQPTLDGETFSGPASDTPPTTRGETSQRETSDTTLADSLTTRPNDQPGPTEGFSTEPTTTGTSGGTFVPPAPPATPPKPKKPGPSDPTWSQDEPMYVTPPVNDPGTLKSISQKYLDEVTENPGKAHGLTTGGLKDEGASGLKKKYADVAYFEVEHVQVHQYDGKGVTVCTVKTVHSDGTETTEQKKLTFDDGAKISDDGK
ncbi:hypothetical protein [Amycolatopsis minnesotensis]|uniref:Uncharacterized protein n=1 Tax=Amycolatopsis minnesotensis TaxID=337894 RepID=A0ABP5BK80_9PSEU